MRPDLHDSRPNIKSRFQLDRVHGLALAARLCSQWGRPVESKPESGTCSKCGYDHLLNAVFCNHCGEQMSP